MSSRETSFDLENVPEGPVTLMFTDVESSTELTARIGDEGWRDLLKRHHETVVGVASEHGGREIKSLGDGLMLVFASARRAVQAAVAIQSALASATAHGEPFRVRIGLNTGEVAHDSGDLLGSAVNAASRIAGRARGGQILAAEVVKQLVGTIPGIEFGDRGRVTLKGFPDRWRLYEVTESEPSDTGFRRAGFVGREEEKEELRDRLAEAMRGAGSLSMIGGEPGIGKTRLAEEIGAEARNRGAIALIGRCHETDSPLPYAPWVEMTNTIARVAPREAFRQALGEDAPEIARMVPEIRRLFPDIPQPLRLPPEQERHYLFTSILNYLDRSSRVQPLLLILDDLQWADEASLLLLTEVAQRLEEMPMFVIGTYRDIELDAARPLANTLENLLRRRLARRVSLRRFSEEGVESLLVSLANRTRVAPGLEGPGSPPPALVKVIYRETEGNPFFVEEVYQHLKEEGRLFTTEGSWRSDLTIEEFEVPESVRLVIGRRIGRLSDSTKAVLTIASLIGGSFSFELLEALEREDPDRLVDAIDEAEAAHLITSARRGAETRIDFAHELIRQTFLSAVSLPRRQRVHLRIADAMENAYSQTGRLLDHVVEIAHHLYQAGGRADSVRAARYLSMSGDLAANSAAFDEARQHYEQALEVLGGDDPRWVADLTFRVGFAQRGMGRWDNALDSWNEALSIYEGLGDATAGRVATAIAYQMSWAGHSEGSLEVARRGLAAIDEGPSRDRARLLAVAAMSTGLLGDADAYEMIVEAESIAAQLSDERTETEVMAARAVIEWAFARPVECTEVSLRAAGAFKRLGDLFQWVGAAPFIEQSLTLTGQFEEADECAREYVPIAEKLGHLGALLTHRRAHAFRDLARTANIAHFDMAAEEDLAAVERVDRNWIGQAQAFKAMSLFYQGRWEEACELALSGGLREPKGVYEGMNRAGVGSLLALAGRVDDALRVVGDAGLSDVTQPMTSGRKMLIVAAAEVFTIAGQRDRAAALFPALSRFIDEQLVFRFWDAKPVYLDAALSAGALGDWKVADSRFDEAMTVIEEVGLKFQFPFAKLLWGICLATWGTSRGDEARAALAEGAEGFEGLGMTRFEELTRTKMTELF